MVRWFRFLITAKVLGLAVVAALWWFVGRPWALRWGSTAEERSRPMPGDELVAEPQYETTKAITIEAGPEDVWPWLAQIGKGRGGLYSVDWLDRVFRILDAPSAEEILPQYQDLREGDVIPIGGTAGWPVRHLERERCLALGNEEPNGVRWSWVFGLYPSADGASTRLVSRNRVSAPAGISRAVMPAVVDPPAFIMTAAMLRGVKRRAAGLAAKRRVAEEAIAVLGR
jgi:hypothetical protein